MSSPLPRRPVNFLRASFFQPAVRILSWTRALTAFALVAAGLGLGGCPGTLDPSLVTGTGGSGGGNGVCDAPTMVFQSTNMQTGCGSDTGCHGAVAHESGLDLVSPGVVSRLLGQAPNPSTSVSCMASTEQYLIANTNPAQGLLIDKLAAGNCGSAMPFPLGGLPQAQTACLKAWALAVTTGVITQ